MDREEEPRLAPPVAEAREDFQVQPVHDVHLHVLPVGQVHVLLLGVAGEGDVPRRPVAQRARRDPDLVHERPVLLEDLDPVVGTVAHVHEAVERGFGAVHRCAELLDERCIRIVGRRPRVVRLVSVGAPVALEGARRGVQHRDAAAAVAVGEVGLVGFAVEGQLGDPVEARLAVAVRRPGLRLAVRSQEFAVARELQDVGVVRPVSADPDVVHVVDRDPVVRAGPHVLVGGASPRVDEVALGIELEHRGRGPAAFPDRRVGVGPAFGALGEVAAVHDEHMVARVDTDPDGRPEHPVIRQLVRPEWIDFEHGGLDGVGRGGLEAILSEVDDHDGQHQNRDEKLVALHVKAPLVGTGDWELGAKYGFNRLSAKGWGFRVGLRGCPAGRGQRGFRYRF